MLSRGPSGPRFTYAPRAAVIGTGETLSTDNSPPALPLTA